MFNNACLTYVVIAALLVGGAGYTLHTYLNLGALGLYLVAINLGTWLVYVLDKGVAAFTKWTRVPERLLGTLAVIGGSVGAFAGMYIPIPFGQTHKTNPAYRALQATVWLSLIGHALLLCCYLNADGPCRQFLDRLVEQARAALALP